MSDTYSLGSVNVDSLKEALSFLAQVYPFADETAKNNFTAQINGLDVAGNPNVPPAVAKVPAAETSEDTTDESPSDDTADETAAPIVEGASAIGTATASTPPEMTADEKIKSLEAQLADAQAAATQTPAATPVATEQNS